MIQALGIALLVLAAVAVGCAVGAWRAYERIWRIVGLNRGVGKPGRGWPPMPRPITPPPEPPLVLCTCGHFFGDHEIGLKCRLCACDGFLALALGGEIRIGRR